MAESAAVLAGQAISHLLLLNYVKNRVVLSNSSVRLARHHGCFFLRFFAISKFPRSKLRKPRIEARALEFLIKRRENINLWLFTLIRVFILLDYNSGFVGAEVVLLVLRFSDVAERVGELFLLYPLLV